MEVKNITIQDIAETAKVSKSTVSRVLNNTTPVNEKKRKAVLAAMKKLNFQPNIFARGLAGGQSMTIGIVTQNIGSPFYDSVAQGVISGLHESDYVPIFVDGQWKREVEEAVVGTLLGRHVDGLIIVGGTLTDEKLAELAQRKPTIVVARQVDRLRDQCLFIDNFEAAYQATQFLIDAGHTQIAHFTGIRRHQDATRRYKGYCQALVDAGIDLNDELVIEGNFSGQAGVIGVESLLMRGQSFSAIFAANDEMAYGARLALYRRGIRVPEDVSIIGFDDQPTSAFMTPPLTTVRQPALAMGRSAARSLIEMLQGTDFRPEPLQSELVIRESVSRLV